MAIRIHEVHPSLAHYPLALLPMAFLLDLVGKLTGRAKLMDAGRQLMPVAAVTGAVTAAAGLVAQEAVEPGDAHSVLVTHRNLNAALLVLVGGLAFARSRKPAPGAGYLLATAGAVLGMTYTAYLGGKMVYRHGVGVRPAGGVREGADPEIRAGQLKESVSTSLDHLAHGARHAAKHLREGSIAPAIRGTAQE